MMEGGHRHEEPTHSKKQLKQAKKEEEFAVRAKMKRLKEEQDARDKVWKDATVVDYHTSDYMDPLPLTGVIDQETIAKAEAAKERARRRRTSMRSVSMPLLQKKSLHGGLSGFEPPPNYLPERPLTPYQDLVGGLIASNLGQGAKRHHDGVDAGRSLIASHMVRRHHEAKKEEKPIELPRAPTPVSKYGKMKASSKKVKQDWAELFEERLVKAAIASDVGTISKIARTHGINLNCRYRGECAMHWAMRHLQAPSVFFLLHNGADPKLLGMGGADVYKIHEKHIGREENSTLHDAWTTCGHIMKGTSLHMAAKINDVSYVEFLVADAGQNTDTKNKYGMTALHIAVEAGRFDLAQVLLENGAKADIRNNTGYTAMDMHEVYQQRINDAIKDGKLEATTYDSPAHKKEMLDLERALKKNGGKQGSHTDPLLDTEAMKVRVATMMNPVATNHMHHLRHVNEAYHGKSEQEIKEMDLTAAFQCLGAKELRGDLKAVGWSKLDIAKLKDKGQLIEAMCQHYRDKAYENEEKKYEPKAVKVERKKKHLNLPANQFRIGALTAMQQQKKMGEGRLGGVYERHLLVSGHKKAKNMQTLDYDLDRKSKVIKPKESKSYEMTHHDKLRLQNLYHRAEFGDRQAMEELLHDHPHGHDKGFKHFVRGQEHKPDEAGRSTLLGALSQGR
jgi:hypothetical protein